MRNTLFIFLVFLIGCSKDPIQKEYTKTTYSNYLGYWNYCRYQTNEIDPELKYFSTEKVIMFENEVVKDTTYCKGLTCPRNGYMTYQTRIKIE
jgi:hypothetical protein